MAKNNYKKERIEIDHWFVTRDDLKLVHNFFEERFGVDNFNIEVNVKSGHNKSFENYQEFNDGLCQLLKNREVIEEIRIIHREQGTDWDNFKQVWIEIPFKGKFYKPNMNIIGGDVDGSYSDWIEGTHNKAKNLMASFEEKDSVLKTYLNNQELSTILDLEESKKNKIITESKEKENSNNFNNSGQINRKNNFQNNLANTEKNFLKEIIIGVAVIVVGGAILYFLGIK